MGLMGSGRRWRGRGGEKGGLEKGCRVGSAGMWRAWRGVEGG